MKKPTTEILAAATQMRQDGTPIKEILATPFAPDGKVDPKNGQTLSYSQFWLYQARQAMDPALDLAPIANDPEKLAEAVAQRRTDGYSWGEIAVHAQLPESRIRKAFQEATGIRHQGLRTGQGGRFLRDDQVLYAEERKVTGVEIPADKAIGQAQAELHAAFEKAMAAARKKAEAAQAKAAKKAAAKK